MYTILFILLYSIVTAILSAVFGLFKISIGFIGMVAITFFISILISKKIESINLDEKSPALFFSFGTFIIAFNLFLYLTNKDYDYQFVYLIELAWIGIAFLLSILRKYVFKSEMCIYRSMISYYVKFIVLFMLLYFNKSVELLTSRHFMFLGVLGVGLFWYFIDIFMEVVQKRSEIRG